MPRVLQAVLALLFALCAAPAPAQEITVQAVLADDRPYIGVPVTLTIVVTGSQFASTPDLPEIPLVRTAFEAASRGTRFQSVNRGGVVTQEFVEYLRIQYAIVADAPGEHTIPPVEITVGGVPYTTDPVTFIAREPRESEDSLAVLETERTRVFVGEPVPVRIVWYTDAARNAHISGPIADDRADLYAPARPRWMVEDGGDSISVNFLNREIRAGLSDYAVRDGAVYDRRVTIDIILVPTDAGPLEFGPFEIEYQRGSRRMRSAPPAVELARTEELVLDVLPLPAGEAPPTFNGLVGVASASARLDESIDELSLKVGDPIPLELTILADEPVSRVRPPDLEAQAEPWSAFQLDPSGWTEIDASATSRTFRTTIRARDDAVEAIPPIEFAFFDPSTERYAAATTRPIPIVVEPTRTINSAETIGATPGAAGAPDGEPLELRDLHAGVLDNASGPALLIDESARVLALLRSPAGIAILALPPLAYAATALVLAVRTRARSPAHRRRTALARARRALARPGAEAERIRDAIRLYIGERFAREAETVTPKECRDLMAGDDAPETGRELASLLTQAERERFDEVADPNPPPIERARELLSKAESGDPA